MSVQKTFRDVAKPKVKSFTATIVGGVLALGEATKLVFSGDAVGTITSLSGHEYLVDGQPVLFVNQHPTNNLTITIGSFSKVIPGGYSEVLYFDEANTTFTSYEASALKQVRADIVSNAAAIAAEASTRSNEDATLVKLDGSRKFTGNVDFNGNKQLNVASGSVATDGINKGQMDSAIAILDAKISANATALSWRSPVDVITKLTNGNIPANADAAVNSNFGAGNNRLFEDDDAPSQATVSSFEVDQTVLFTKAGQEPKLMVLRDVLGTKRWYDETEVDVAKKLPRQVVAGDTFIVKTDLTDINDSREGSAIFAIKAGSPKTAIKIADLDWDSATGITISTAFAVGAGGQTIVAGDSVEAAFQKLAGNIVKNAADAASALSSAIAAEVTARNSAISSAIAQEVLDRNSAITTSQTAQNNNLASTAAAQGASLVGINDAAGIITATTVEGALQENRAKIDTLDSEVVVLQSQVAANTSAISTNTSDIAALDASLVQYKSDVASVTVGKGASLVGVADAAGKFTATTVEGVLAEINNKVDNLKLVTLKRGLFEASATGGLTINLATDFKNTLAGGGIIQDLSGASYINATLVRDGAVLVGGIGYTIAGGVLTLTAAGGGEMLVGEVFELKIIDVA